MKHDAAALLPGLRRIHERIRDAVVDACERQEADALAAVAGDDADGGDTIYAVDRVSEDLLVDLVARELTTPERPVVLVAEGLTGGAVVLPRGARAEDAVFRIIVDPIDGTRGLMYQKRSAWILTGVAPNLGPTTSLGDIEAALQTEIPLIKQHQGDVLWAVRGQGAHAVRHNRLTGETRALSLRPSRATTLAHGFASVARFFPGARDVLAAVDDDIARALDGVPAPGRALCFEDQYISTGGQLYELMMGHDRFIADVRPCLAPVLAARGWPAPLACHPYDLCTALIAREAGVVISDEHGCALRAPLDTTTDVSWVGVANQELAARALPALQSALGRHGLLAS